MVTVHREAGFRFVIYLDDHAPAHVHVFGPGEAKVVLKGADCATELVYSVGMSRADLRRLLRIVDEHGDVLRARWTLIHG